MKKEIAKVLIVALICIGLVAIAPLNSEAKKKKIDTCPYKAGQILGGKKIISCEKFIVDGYNRGYRITFEDGTTARYASLDSLCYGDTNNLEYDVKYMVCRTDFSDGLIDLDGNGLDDRDPLNTSGLVDTNFNCVVDGAPLLLYGYVNDWRAEPYEMRFHHCEHNIVEDFYGTVFCKTCAAEIAAMPKFG